MKDLKVAVVQDCPVFMDLDKTLDKMEDLLALAKKEKPNLVLFPEAFVSGYPRGLTFGTVVGSRKPKGRELWQRYFDSSVEIGDGAFKRLGKMARENDVLLVVGVVEKVKSGTLYCSIFYFDKKGDFLGSHRKLKPTAAERVIWGEGKGDDLEVLDTELGRVGGLICWENYMPLARTWLYQQSIELYCAPTADHRESWQHTLRHIATEGRCYVLGCNQFVLRSDYPKDLPGEDRKSLPVTLTRGGSVIVDPYGETIAGPLWDRKGILIGQLSADPLTQSKMDMDVAGHYARNDVFELRKKA